MICFDTMILGWAIRPIETEARIDMALRTKAYLKRLRQEGEEVMLSAVTIQEFLYRHPPVEEHHRILAILERDFLIVSYDAEMGSLATRILLQAQSKSKVDKTKHCVRADCQIIATAVRAGASAIVSDDDGFRKLAKGHISVIDVPEALEEQEPLSL